MNGPPVPPPVADPAAAAGLRVVVADDQTVVRDGLVLLLGLLPDVEVVGAAGDGDQAVALVAELAPDVVLMDLRMPRCDGVEATRRIRKDHPGVAVVVLTTYADDESIFTALAAGVRGYLTKDATATEIAHALRTVTAGHALLDPAVQHRLIEALTHPPTPPDTTTPAAAAAMAAPSAAASVGRSLPDRLTAREGEILTLIAAGLSNAEIAAGLFVTEATVKTHINHLLAKTGLRDRAQAVAYAYRHGLAGQS